MSIFSTMQLNTTLQRQDLAALLEVSKALSRESDLDRLLALITDKATEVLNADRSTLFLYDDTSDELWSKIAQKLGTEEIRFPVGIGIAGAVAKTLKSEIITEPYKDSRFNAAFDKKTGFRTYSILCAPVLDSERQLLGVIQVLNKGNGQSFDHKDSALLEAFASHAAVALERGKAQEALAQAHSELQSLYNAKTKMINHLSHELKTPLSIISASFKMLRNDATRLDPARLQRLLERVNRNLQRLLELESEARDIAQHNPSRQAFFLQNLIQQASDHLASIGEQEDDYNAETLESHARALSQYIEQFFRTHPDQEKSSIHLCSWIPQVLSTIEPLHQHRRVDLSLELETVAPILMPEPPLRKAFIGLVRNAIENTNDGGRISIHTCNDGDKVCLHVQDYELGISDAFQQQLFHGFVHPEDTADYTSSVPYAFKAGGKGLDLLRTKLFAERYGFDIQVASELGKGSCFTLTFAPLDPVGEPTL